MAPPLEEWNDHNPHQYTIGDSASNTKKHWRRNAQRWQSSPTRVLVAEAHRKTITKKQRADEARQAKTAGSTYSSSSSPSESSGRETSSSGSSSAFLLRVADIVKLVELGR